TRVSWNPGAEWSAAVWFGHLAASGGAHVHDALDRFGASVVRTHGSWSTALVYGADLAAGAGHPLNTLLLETTIELNEVNAVYGRAEYVRRTAVHRSEEHTSELQSLRHLVCRLLLEKKKKRKKNTIHVRNTQYNTSCT